MESDEEEVGIEEVIDILESLDTERLPGLSKLAVSTELRDLSPFPLEFYKVIWKSLGKVWKSK